MVTLPRCPTCDKLFDPAQTPAMPFCSERCRQIDLGRWLREQHSVPVTRLHDDEDPELPADEGA